MPAHLIALPPKALVFGDRDIAVHPSLTSQAPILRERMGGQRSTGSFSPSWFGHSRWLSWISWISWRNLHGAGAASPDSTTVDQLRSIVM